MSREKKRKKDKQRREERGRTGSWKLKARKGCKVRSREGNEGLSFIISVIFIYLLYALQCKFNSCRHVFFNLYINRNKNSLYKTD